MKKRNNKRNEAAIHAAFYVKKSPLIDLYGDFFVFFIKQTRAYLFKKTFLVICKRSEEMAREVAGRRGEVAA